MRLNRWVAADAVVESTEAGGEAGGEAGVDAGGEAGGEAGAEWLASGSERLGPGGGKSWVQPSAVDANTDSLYQTCRSP